jgi:hypothetical protein
MASMRVDSRNGDSFDVVCGHPIDLQCRNFKSRSRNGRSIRFGARSRVRRALAARRQSLRGFA